MDLVERFAPKPPLFDCTPAGLIQQLYNSMRFLESEYARPHNQSRIAEMNRAHSKLLEQIRAIEVTNV